MDNLVRRSIAALALFALACCSGKQPSPSAADANQAVPGAVAHVGQPAPNWTEPIVPAGTLTLSSLRGKPVYLNFFASWCPPCNDEAPGINELQKQFAARGLRVVGIDVLENAKKAESFRTEHGL